jgi:hypothetical protein
VRQHRERETSRAVARQPEALGSGRLHRHPLDRDPERGGQPRTHLVAARLDRGPFGDHGHVGRDRQAPGHAHLRDRPGQQLDALHAGHPRIRFREMLADVAEPRRAEQGVGERVTHGIAVGVPSQPRFAVEAQAAEEQLARVIARMDVEAEPDELVIHALPPPSRDPRPT